MAQRAVHNRRSIFADPGFHGCVGLFAYLAAVVLTRPISPDAPDRSFYGQLAGVLLVIVLSLPFLGLTLGRLAEGNRRSSLVFHLFWLAVAVTIPFAHAPVVSGIYVVVTFCVYAALGNVWLAPRPFRAVVAGLVAVACFGLATWGLLRFDLNVGRFVGAMTPNHFAAISLTPLLLSFMLPRWPRRVVQMISLGLILHINARGALVAWILYSVVWLWGNLVIRGTWRSTVTVLAAVALVLLAAVVLIPPLRLGVTKTVNEAFALDDPFRGVDSGFSGRENIWEKYGTSTEECLITGIGFRGPRAEVVYATSHNAYIDLLRETGVVAAGLFLLFAGLRVFQLVRTVLWRRLDRTRREEAAGVLASMTAVMFLAFFEAWLLNIGFPIGVCALLLYSFHEPLQESARIVRSDSASREPAREAVWAT